MIASPPRAEEIPGIYLRACLAPLAGALARPDVTDIYVNRPGEMWIETLGGNVERIDDPALTEATLERLSRQVAALSHQGISREHPLLAATLPDGSRIQVAAPPSTRGPLALAIRRQVSADLTLQDYAKSEAFRETRVGAVERRDDDELDSLIAGRKFPEALGLAVRSRRNIIVSGGTSTGKTTFLNALLKEIPEDERLITIEDTPELIVRQPNSVGLLSVRGELGEALVTANDLVSASLRMRPDRIIIGELRGPEAFAFLRAIASGHPGSMTSVHADSPEAAVEQLVMLVLQTCSRVSRADIRYMMTQSIDLFVHLGRSGGSRRIEAIVSSRDMVAAAGFA